MNLTSKILRKLVEVNVHFSISPSDLVICEYPKSGITYFSFLLANYLLILDKSDIRASFFNLNFFVQDLHRTPSIDKSFKFKSFYGRLLKSHASYNFIRYPQKIILIRNPAKTMLSYYRHIENSSPGSFSDLSKFVKSKKYGIHSWIQFYIHHLNDTNPLGQALFTFESNLLDPIATLENFCILTGTLFCTESANKACLATSLKNMALNEDTTSRLGLTKINSRFVGAAAAKTERDYLLESISAYIDRAVQRSRLPQLIPPEIANKIGLNI